MSGYDTTGKAVVCVFYLLGAVKLIKLIGAKHPFLALSSATLMLKASFNSSEGVTSEGLEAEWNDMLYRISGGDCGKQMEETKNVVEFGFH